MRVLGRPTAGQPQAFTRFIQSRTTTPFALVQRWRGDELQAPHRVLVHPRARARATMASWRSTRPAEFLPSLFGGRRASTSSRPCVRTTTDDHEGTRIRWEHQFLHTDQAQQHGEVLARMNAHIGQRLSIPGARRRRHGQRRSPHGMGSGRLPRLRRCDGSARRMGIANAAVSGLPVRSRIDRANQKART